MQLGPTLFYTLLHGIAKKGYTQTNPYCSRVFKTGQKWCTLRLLMLDWWLTAACIGLACLQLYLKTPQSSTYTPQSPKYFQTLSSTKFGLFAIITVSVKLFTSSKFHFQSVTVMLCDSSLLWSVLGAAAHVCISTYAAHSHGSAAAFFFFIKYYFLHSNVCFFFYYLITWSELDYALTALHCVHLYSDPVCVHEWLYVAH